MLNKKKSTIIIYKIIIVLGFFYSLISLLIDYFKYGVGPLMYIDLIIFIAMTINLAVSTFVLIKRRQHRLIQDRTQDKPQLRMMKNT